MEDNNISKGLANSNTNTQWHTAFYSTVQIELKEYADNLSFESEHQLGSKPREADVLIIQNDMGLKIKKNIGWIFRKHNIMEYKSPNDYLSIDDYYLILSYAYVYKADTAKIDQIKIILPTQFILTTEVDTVTNMWLSGLTNNLTDVKLATNIMKEYGRNSKNNLYQSVMYVILKENQIFRGGDFMDDSGLDLLEEFFKDRLDSIVEKRAEKRAEEIVEKRAEEMANKKLAEKDAQNASIVAKKDAEIAALKAQLKALAL